MSGDTADSLVNKLLEYAENDSENNANDGDILNLLKAINGLPDAKARIRKLRKKEAQVVVNLLQRISDLLRHPPQADKSLRYHTCRLLVDLSKNSDCLSSSLEVELTIPFNSLKPFTGGGYADVYDYTISGRAVCIKKLRLFTIQDHIAQANVKRNLCREAMTARQFNHPNLLELLCICRPHISSLCIITPKINPGNLLDYQKPPFCANTTKVDPLPLLIKVMDGLLYLHQEKFVHGDIKAANVLVDENGHVYLCDYGFTAFGDTTNGFQTNTDGGTHMRMAPELLHPSYFGLKERKRTVATDIYACGMLFLEAYTLRDPFRSSEESLRDPLRSSEEYIDLVQRVVLDQGRPRKPSIQDCHGRILPRDLWQLIQSCWKQACLERPDTQAIRDVLEALTPSQ